MTDKQIIRLTSHYADDYEACPLYFHRRANLKRGPASAAPQLAIGTAFHQLLAEYYRQIAAGKTIDQAIELSKEAFEISSLSISGLDLDESPRIIQTFLDYCEHYSNDHFEILAVEQKLSALLYEDDEHKVLYEGTVDLIIRNQQDMIEPWDHKTESAKYHVSGLGNQFVGYCFLTNQPRMVRNAVGLQKSKKPEERMYRQMFTYSQAFIEWWKTNTATTAIQMMQSYKKDIWPAKLNACDTMHHFKGCPFRSVCNAGPNMWDIMLEEEFVHVELYS